MVSPPDEDADRIAETIFNDDVSNNIQDEDSFFKAYKKYLDKTDLENNKEFMSRTFESFLREHPARMKDPDFYEKREVSKKVPKQINLYTKDKDEFRYLGKARGRIVFLRKDIIKEKEVFRDRRGNIGKPKKR